MEATLEKPVLIEPAAKNIRVTNHIYTKSWTETNGDKYTSTLTVRIERRS